MEGKKEGREGRRKEGNRNLCLVIGEAAEE
jgi:hypothetical protein